MKWGTYGTTHDRREGSPFISRKGRQTPLRITAIYVALGGFLLVLSDVVLPSLIADAGLLRSVQGIKGALEVLVTGVVIYALSRQMEQQLQRSERSYRHLVEASPAPINLFDEDGATVWGNDSVLELLGIDDRRNLTGRSIFEFIEGTDHETAADELTRVVEGEETTGPTEMRLRRSDGEVRHVRVSTAPGWYRGAEVGQAVVVDVTDLREAEAELRAERDFIRNALDELRDIFYVVSPDGTLERWNRQLEEVTGYEEETLASLDVTEFFDAEDHDRLDDAMESALEQGTAFFEADLLGEDGKLGRYEFKSARLRGRDDPDRVVGIGRDVTEQKRMQRELRENEQRYRTLVEMSPHAILVHRDGEIVYGNDAFVDLVGANDSESVLGDHVNTFLHPDEHEDANRTTARTQRGLQAPTDNRRTVLTREGEQRHVETTSRPIAYEEEPAVLTVVKDVTHRHRYEEMLTTLHERTRTMTRAEDRARIAEIAVETTDELLGLDGSVVYAFDGGDELRPIAWSEELADADVDVQPGGNGDGALWEAFVDGDERVVETREGAGLPGTGHRFVDVLPLGNQGVLAVVSEGGLSLSTTRRNVLDLITENLNAALERAEREGNLRDRDQQLEQQNEALEQLNRLNEIIREINQALVQSTTRSEVMERACRRLSAADQYSFAWIGTRDSVDGHVVPQHWSGIDAEYIDHLGATDSTPTPLQELVDAAFRENSVQVAQNLLEKRDWEAHRRDALNRGYRSVVAVPVVEGGHVDSVLVIHAEDGDIFDEQERAVLEELGDTIGYALRNIEQTTALQSDERIEIELEIGDETLLTNRFTAELDAEVSLVGVVADGADTLQLFLRFEGAVADLCPRLEAHETVTAVQPLSTGEESGLYRFTVSTPPLVRILQRNGVRVRSLTAAEGRSTLVGVLPDGVNVRGVVEALRSAYPDTELLARRTDAVPIDTRETFRDRLLDQLTDRQREALQTASYSGFYEWPRATKSEDLAEMLDIASSTYQYHLRAAERVVVSSVLDAA